MTHDIREALNFLVGTCEVDGAFRDPSLLRGPNAAPSEPAHYAPIDQPDLEIGAGDETALLDGGLSGLDGMVRADLGPASGVLVAEADMSLVGSVRATLPSLANRRDDVFGQS